MSTLDDVRSAFAGRYQVESEIGQGGSARVYAALDLKHDRRVAIKVLKHEIAESLAVHRFLREIRVDAALQHPHILPLFDSGEVLGAPFFVMPFIEGTSLRARLEREARLPVREAVQLALQIADALAYAHAKGFVHRDVKPENVMLSSGDAWLGDFGIARALREATNERVTGTGIALGTLAYMSPEQRSADAELDGRSDQFSLACVVYEMLVGRPPYSTSGHDRGPMDARVSTLTPARTLRGDVPRSLNAVLMRALSIRRDDRFPSMGEFRDALRASLDTPSGLAGVSGDDVAGRWGLMAGVAAVVLMAGVWLTRRAPADEAVLDAEAIVVLPLAHEGDSLGAMLNGDDCSRLLRDALARWTGIHQIDDMRLREARRTLGRRPETVAEAMAMARRLGAGMAVWGLVEPPLAAGTPGARMIRVFLYDVSRDGAVRREARGLIDPRTDLTNTFQDLVDSLLTGSVDGARQSAATGTRDLVSLRAYVDAHRALDAWDLPRARDAFRRSADRDPRYGLAHLWLAQTTAWMPDADAADWGAEASRALQVGEGLSARDSALAHALVAMSVNRHQQACDAYRALLERDRRDFSAWFGLGECLNADRTVERDARSRSGWRFRTSTREAVAAYDSALALVPSFPNAFGRRAIERLTAVLFAEPGRFRLGIAPQDSSRFAAWPELDGDTLAFVPFPEREVFAVAAPTRSPTNALALQRNRDRLTDLAERWVRADSLNVNAFEALALARESSGELESVVRSPASGGFAAVPALRRARALASGDDAIRLAALEVRLHLKLDRYAVARALADSLLRVVRPGSTDARAAAWMHGLAMLTGRLGLAIDWGRRSILNEFVDPTRPDLRMPQGLASAGSDALTYASAGAPADSVRAALARAEAALRFAPAAAAEPARQFFMEWPFTLAWPEAGRELPWSTRTSAGNLQLDAALALARGDSTEGRRHLARLDSVTIDGGEENIWYDYADVSGRMWLMLGDTASAVRMLDFALDTRRTSGRQLIEWASPTAGLVRVMVLRASLAQSAGDSPRARLWAERAWALWRDADAMLQPILVPIARWRE